MIRLPSVVSICPSVRVKVKPCKTNNKELRKPMLRSMGCSFLTATEPHVDTNHTASTALGAVYRNGRNVPPCMYRAELKIFAQNFFNNNFTPIDSVMSFEDWLADTTYNEARKNQLRKCRERLGEFNLLNFQEDKFLTKFDITKVDCFVKDEQYPEFKHSRGIYARSDYFKVLFGPIIKSIEKSAYKTEFFIKNVPVKDRARFLNEALGECNHIFTGDFKSFESHSTADMYSDVLIPFYKHMSKHLPEYQQKILMCMINVLNSTNTLDFRTFTMKVRSKKCSGEMDTSLSNGVLDIILMYFIAHKLQLPSFRAKVEGDDSVGGYCGIKMAATDFTQFGCIITFQEFDDPCEASFCGLVYDKATLTQMTDAIHAMARMCVKRKYLNACPASIKALARAKAACMMFQYNGCPILTSFANYIIRCTNNVRIRKTFIEDTTYHPELRAMLESKLDIKPKPVPSSARETYNKIYGVSIEHQIVMENYLDSLTEYQPITHPVFRQYLKDDWIMYHDYYSTATKECLGTRGCRIITDIAHITKGDLYQSD